MHALKGPFCKMTVYDRRLHPEQCVIRYQVSVQWLRNQTVEDPPVTQQPKPEPKANPLSRFFAPKPCGTASESSGTATIKPKQEERRRAASLNTDAVDQEAGQRESRRRYKFRVLSSSANSCYANSLMQALAAVSLRGYDLGSFQKTLDIISDPADSRPLSLFGLFEFRHLLTGWRRDGRQHDVTEFLSHLQQNPVGSAQPVNWQGR